MTNFRAASVSGKLFRCISLCLIALLTGNQPAYSSENSQSWYTLDCNLEPDNPPFGEAVAYTTYGIRLAQESNSQKAVDVALEYSISGLSNGCSIFFEGFYVYETDASSYLYADSRYPEDPYSGTWKDNDQIYPKFMQGLSEETMADCQIGGKFSIPSGMPAEQKKCMQHIFQRYFSSTIVFAFDESYANRPIRRLSIFFVKNNLVGISIVEFPSVQRIEAKVIYQRGF